MNFNCEIMDNELTYDDVKEYEQLFTLTPSFLLERFAKKNKNLALKFHSRIKYYLDNLTDEQRHKLDLILKTDVEQLQNIMVEAYLKSGKKQYQILANPKYRQFIEDNLDEIRKLIN